MEGVVLQNLPIPIAFFISLFCLISSMLRLCLKIDESNFFVDKCYYSWVKCIKSTA